MGPSYQLTTCVLFPSKATGLQPQAPSSSSLKHFRGNPGAISGRASKHPSPSVLHRRAAVSPGGPPHEAPARHRAALSKSLTLWGSGKGPHLCSQSPVAPAAAATLPGASVSPSTKWVGWLSSLEVP